MAAMTTPDTGAAADLPGDVGPLDGLVVLDLTRFVSGPYCTMLLADAGADVIKVEPPKGDPTRYSKAIDTAPGVQPIGGTFLRFNRGKRSVVLDTSTEAGRRALADLVKKADVLVENFRPGVLERMGFGWSRLQELNPALVYCTITGFGTAPTPERDRPAFNLIAEFEAGLYVRSTPVPEPMGPYFGDLVPGLHALSGLLMALYRRSVTGRGAQVDIAMFDSVLSVNEQLAVNQLQWGVSDDSDDRNTFCPSGLYAASDGFLVIDVVTPKQWRTMAEVIGAPTLGDDDRLKTGPGRAAHFDSLIEPALTGWLMQRSSEAAVKALSSAGVPSGVVREPGAALACAQTRARHMQWTVSAPGGAELVVVGNPIRFVDAPVVDTVAAPTLGHDTVSILMSLCGYTEAEAEALVGSE